MFNGFRMRIEHTFRLGRVADVISRRRCFSEESSSIEARQAAASGAGAPGGIVLDLEASAALGDEGTTRALTPERIRIAGRTTRAR